MASLRAWLDRRAAPWAYFDIFTGDSAKEAAAANASLYQDYGSNANQILDTALPKETAAVQGGINAYTPLRDLGTKYGAAGDMLLNALGVNGASGNAAARAAYHTSPGYDFATSQALDAATRAGNAMGATGNTLDEVTRRAAGYADQDYNTWLGNLSGLAGMGTSATGAAAGGEAAGYYMLPGIYGQNASDKIGVAGNVASGTALSNTQAANSQMQASSNFWNGLMQLGGNVAKAAAGGGGK